MVAEAEARAAKAEAGTGDWRAKVQKLEKFAGGGPRLYSTRAERTLAPRRRLDARRGSAHA